VSSVDGLFGARSAALDAAAPAWPESFVHLRRVDSTQRLARRFADALAQDDEKPRPAAFVAFEQTAGKGRLGNRWASPAGRGLYVSWLAPLDAATALLPLRVGARLAGALAGFSHVPVRLKWPNDLLLEGRKAGGILISTFRGGGGATLAAIGLGLNLDEVEDVADLRAGRIAGLSWIDALRVASTAIHDALGDRGEAELEAIERLLVHRRGETLRFRSGERRIEGSYEGLDDQGRIRVGVGGRVESFASGEVIEE
jgi:BirA family biotin operon repressor/biotin-[acetyl-CoA-carboxylase] ligase